MKRRSFIQQILRAGVAAMTAPLILREVIRADLPVIEFLPPSRPCHEMMETLKYINAVMERALVIPPEFLREP